MANNIRNVWGSSGSQIASNLCWDARECPEHGVETMMILEMLGFTSDLATGTASDLAITMGSFILYATFCFTDHIKYEILFRGNHSTARIKTMIDFRMPVLLDSIEMTIAWLTWNLEEPFKNQIGVFAPYFWLDIGRQNYHLLPWEKRRLAHKLKEAAYQASPRCTATRTDSRRIIHSINKFKCQEDDSMIRLRFDGEVLKIDTPGLLLAIPAHGEAWKDNFMISPSTFMSVQRSFHRNFVEWAIFEDRFQLDRRELPGKVLKEHIPGQLDYITDDSI